MLKLTTKQALKRIAAGERLEYAIDWAAKNDIYNGTDVVGTPEPDVVAAKFDRVLAMVDHDVKCAVHDRQGGHWFIRQRGWRVIA